MERIVYLLGAGFSAPLGIPVMSNFLKRSKDMFYLDEKKYPHFKKVFDTINRMAFAKNFYSADLENIEEILSILETQETVSGRKCRDLFVRYLSDVVEQYTPQFPKPCNTTGEYHGNRVNALAGYPYFVGNIMNASITYAPAILGNRSIFHVEVTRDAHDVEYSVVSLNYDMVLENIWAGLQHSSDAINFGLVNNERTVCLAKLHGSVGEDIMVAPTWNKTITTRMKKVWKSAYEVLSNANQLRIIGYSLPVSDAYVRYLLKAAVLNTKHLHAIDILSYSDTWPFDGTISEEWRRYREFITHPNARVSFSGAGMYMKELSLPGNQGQVFFNSLESCHSRFFDSTSKNLHAKGKYI